MWSHTDMCFLQRMRDKYSPCYRCREFNQEQERYHMCEHRPLLVSWRWLTRPTGSFIRRGVWTLIEANTGIICACLPMLKQPLTIIFPRLFRGTTKDQSDRPSKDSHQLDSHPNSKTWVSPDGTIVNSVKTSVTAGAPSKSPYKGDEDEEEQTAGWHHKHLPQSILRQTEVVVSRQGEAESTSSSSKKPASVKEHV